MSFAQLFTYFDKLPENHTNDKDNLVERNENSLVKKEEQELVPYWLRRRSQKTQAERAFVLYILFIMTFLSPTLSASPRSPSLHSPVSALTTAFKFPLYFLSTSIFICIFLASFGGRHVCTIKVTFRRHPAVQFLSRAKPPSPRRLP